MNPQQNDALREALISMGYAPVENTLEGTSIVAIGCILDTRRNPSIVDEVITGLTAKDIPGIDLYQTYNIGVDILLFWPEYTL